MHGAGVESQTEYITRREFEPWKTDIHNLKLDVWGKAGEKDSGLKSDVARIRVTLKTYGTIAAICFTVLITMIGWQIVFNINLAERLAKAGMISQDAHYAVQQQNKTEISADPSIKR